MKKEIKSQKLLGDRLGHGSEAARLGALGFPPRFFARLPLLLLGGNVVTLGRFADDVARSVSCLGKRVCHGGADTAPDLLGLLTTRYRRVVTL